MTRSPSRPRCPAPALPSPPRSAAVTDARTAVVAALNAAADPARAAGSARFFKTAPGEYAAGDVFLGVAVPAQRRLVARYARDLSLDDCEALLASPFHEVRLVALLVMVQTSERGDAAVRADVARSYLAHAARVNNWDLVDSSAASILGPVATDAQLARLARSPQLWERRIAMIATLHAIQRGDPAPALRVAGALLHDAHDLIHKAVGWMLREVGKRDRVALDAFLDQHAATMPRTALRYALERHPPRLRARYMAARAAARAHDP